MNHELSHRTTGETSEAKDKRPQHFLRRDRHHHSDARLNTLKTLQTKVILPHPRCSNTLSEESVSITLTLFDRSLPGFSHP